MNVIPATLSALVLSCSLALAQTGGTGGSTGGSTASPPAASPPGVSPPNPSPQGSMPAPSDGATTGRGPGVNPSNPQDLKGRSNPQDLTQPGGSNPQNLKSQIAPGVPNIIAPER